MSEFSGLKADQHFGFISRYHDHIAWIEMDSASNRPPPAFGSFVQCVAEDEIFYGIVFNGKIKNIDLNNNPVDMEQSPSVVSGESKKPRVKLTAELQAVVIGSAIYGTGQFRRHFYKQPVTGSAVSVLNETELMCFASDFSYFRTVIGLRYAVPAEELLISLIRKFAAFFSDQRQYASLIGKELNKLFTDDHTLTGQIILRSGIYSKNRG